MPKASSIAEGLQIQEKYAPGGWCSAEHDIFYGPCSSDHPISKEDMERLNELGWFIDEESDSWACFT